MAIYQGNIEKHIFGGSVRKKHAYLGSAMKYQYDSTPPSLTVTAPAGNPTYAVSDSAMGYTVYGTVSDASGIASVTVNGNAASISGNNWSYTLSNLATNTAHTITVVARDNTGYETSISRRLEINTYYRDAVAQAGGNPSSYSSLHQVLTDSNMCTKLAGSSTAYGIMKSKYSADMKAYITSNYTDGLNALNKACTLDYYIFRNGYYVGGQSGATRTNTTNGTAVFDNTAGSGLRIGATSGRTESLDAGVWGTPRTTYGRFNTTVSMTGYSSIVASVYMPSTIINSRYYYKAMASVGISTNAGATTSLTATSGTVENTTWSGTTKSITCNVSSVSGNYYVCVMGGWNRTGSTYSGDDFSPTFSTVMMKV